MSHNRANGRRTALRPIPWIIGILALASAGAYYSSGRSEDKARSDLLASLPRASVRRVDFNPTVSATGRVESRQQTTIRCEIENLEIRNQGRNYSSGGASTILSVVPDGSYVAKDEIVCSLDSSSYEEVVRTQLIRVERDRSEKIAAELQYQVAQVGLREFEGGIFLREVSTLAGKIALSESDIARAKDRIAWSGRMLGKGYLSQSQINSERQALMQAEHTLAVTRGKLDVYRKFGAPKILHGLKNKVESARVHLVGETSDLTRQDDRLALYQKMVARCTIRAPHEGMLIYAKNPFDESRNRIEVGVTVRQNQELFWLPDLTQMNVIALMHETIVDRVKKGMIASIKVEGLPGRTIAGRVDTVYNIPVLTSTDVKHYQGVIRLDSIPDGLRPGMTAAVDVLTEERHDVLAVPPDAVAVEDGHQVCYVAAEDGLFRRNVRLGESTRELLEITDGLEEGDQVVLDPSTIAQLPELILDLPPGPPDEVPTASVATLQ